MPRTNDYVLEVKTARHLGSEDFAHSLLTAWRTQLNPRLVPEFYSLGEPIRCRFEDGGIEGAVQLWVANKMPVMLRRKSKPRFVADIKWRSEKGQDPRPFPWGCHVFLDRSAGDDLALDLFRFLVNRFEPAFGSISTEEDSRAKHFVVWQDRGSTAQQYMGLDVGRFVTVRLDYGREVLPGVYWITYFGPGAKRIIGEQSLECLQADHVEKLGDGYLVRAYPSSNEAGTLAAHQAEGEIADSLGREHFFDKAHVNVESLKTDEVTAARVERKIAEIKKARK
jgi:hypothetical protein